MSMASFLKSRSTPAEATPQTSADGFASSGLRARVLDEFEQAGIGWIWATDRDGRLSYLSHKAVEALVRIRPATADELASLADVGPATRERHGTRLLAIVAEPTSD